jgi:hypothetical protein
MLRHGREYMATKVVKTTPDIIPGQMATFAIETDLIAPYKFLWKKDGVYCVGAGSDKTYTTPPLSNADFRAVFSCTVFGQDKIEEAVGIALNPNMPDPITISNTPPPKAEMKAAMKSPVKAPVAPPPPPKEKP